MFCVVELHIRCGKKYEDMRKRWHKPRPAADQENESFSLQCVVHKLYIQFQDKKGSATGKRIIQ
jgi:hypothetical protein